MPGAMGDDALLVKSLRQLMQNWAASESTWRDQARADFAHLHLLPIEERARSAIIAIKKIEQLIDEVKRACT
jgi:hypothetical protein